MPTIQHVLPALLVLGACSGAEAPAAASGSEEGATSAPTTTTTTTAARGPEILVDSITHDFGAVSDVRPLEHTFQLMNTGDAPLAIGELDADCRCTTTALESTTIEPGDMQALEVSWDVIGSGRQRKTILLHSNAGSGPVLLSLSADIHPFVSAAPRILDFGTVHNTELQRARVELFCDDLEFSVESITCLIPELRAQLVEDPADGRATLEVVLAPTDRVGLFAPRVQVDVRGRVEVGGEPILHRFEFPVRANLYRELLAEPAMVAVGRVELRGKVGCTVRISRPAGGAFAITGTQVQCSVESLTAVVRAVSGTDAAYDITLVGEVGDFEGRISGHLILATDLPGEPTRSLAIAGMVR
ncbi:MAG: DUF1573 domain-containing protein [Planctomycetota bacterium]